MPPTNQKEVLNPAAPKVSAPESQTAAVVEVDKLHDKAIEKIRAQGVDAKKPPQDQGDPVKLADFLKQMGAYDTGGGEIGPDAAALTNANSKPPSEKKSLLGEISEFFKQLYWTIHYKAAQRIRGAEASNHEILELKNAYAQEHGYKLTDLNEHKPKETPAPVQNAPEPPPTPEQAAAEYPDKIVVYPTNNPVVQTAPSAQPLQDAA